MSDEKIIVIKGTWILASVVGAIYITSMLHYFIEKDDTIFIFFNSMDNPYLLLIVIRLFGTTIGGIIGILMLSEFKTEIKIPNLLRKRRGRKKILSELRQKLHKANTVEEVDFLQKKIEVLAQ